MELYIALLVQSLNRLEFRRRGPVDDNHRSLVGLYLYGEFLLFAEYRRHVGQVDLHVHLLTGIHQVTGPNDPRRVRVAIVLSRPLQFVEEAGP